MMKDKGVKKINKYINCEQIRKVRNLILDGHTVKEINKITSIPESTIRTYTKAERITMGLIRVTDKKKLDTQAV